MEVVNWMQLFIRKHELKHLKQKSCLKHFCSFSHKDSLLLGEAYIFIYVAYRINIKKILEQLIYQKEVLKPMA